MMIVMTKLGNKLELGLGWSWAWAGFGGKD
jgi:hypothetical protein